jgi:hypothetical protein
MAGTLGDPAIRPSNKLAALHDILRSTDLFQLSFPQLVALKMARYIGFATALAATGAFAMTPEYVNVLEIMREPQLT